MKKEESLFGALFTKFRLRAEFLTLSEFGKALADEGLLYEESIFSRWQKGNRIPKDRKLLLTIIKIFLKRKGITSCEEANHFLEAAHQGYLTNTEEKELAGMFDIAQDVSPAFQGLTSTDDFQVMLSTIADTSEKLPAIEKQIDLFYEIIYAGYTSMVYEYLQRLITLIQALKLDDTQDGKNLISKINWMRVKCLNEMSGKLNEYENAIQDADSAILYAKENATTNLGELYWMRFSLERKKYLTYSKSSLSRQKMLQGLAGSQLAITSIPAKDKTRINALLEIIYYSLALRDQELYDRTLFDIFSLVENLPSDIQFLKAFAWDAKARGYIRFGLKVEQALESIKNAKSYSHTKYQTVNLNLQGTEFQALELSPDPRHHAYANVLREELFLKASFLENPYQRMRFEKKKFLGI